MAQHHRIKYICARLCTFQWTRFPGFVSFSLIVTIGIVLLLGQFYTIFHHRDNPLHNDETAAPDTSNFSQKVIQLRPANVEEYVSCGTIFVDYRGLGNQLFNLAAVVHVAYLTNRRPALIRYPCKYHIRPFWSCPHKMAIEEVFDLKVEMFDNLCPCYTMSEAKITYDRRVEEQARFDNPETRNKSIVVEGYRQGWKYVRLVEHQLKDHLEFLPAIRNFTDRFFERTIPPSWTKKYFVRVGIHVRRDSVLWENSIKYGHATPNQTFFWNAMEYFINRYERVQFIICSDDMDWSKQNIRQDDFNSSTVNITYSAKDVSAAQDFGILSHCNHVIISSGSFGWWAAWLTRGTAVFFKHWPIKNTPFYSSMELSDYWPPHWLPME